MDKLKNRIFSRLFSVTLNVMLKRERSELPRASRNIKAIPLKETKCIAPRLFSVIFGLVPLILVQRVTNLVNKLAILFKRSMFQQDCRNGLCVMSGDDWCSGCGHSICCKFFKQTYHPGSSANELTLKVKDDNKSVLQFGRSMIEMLGVLAIITVLSECLKDAKLTDFKTACQSCAEGRNKCAFCIRF